MDLIGWLHAARLRGFTPRQRRLLYLEAVYEGTQYFDLFPWSPEEQVIDGQRRTLSRCERAPGVRLGLASSRVDRLHDLLVGAGRFPTLSSASEKLTKALLVELNAETSLGLPVNDIIVKGSGALAIHRAGSGRFVPVYVDTTFAEPIFASQAGTERARVVAEEFEALGIKLPAPAKGDFLFVPEGTDLDDVIFVRVQYPYDDELAGIHHAIEHEPVRWVRRRDYLPTMLIEYEDQRVGQDTMFSGPWVVETQTRHEWGVVPVAWARSPRARPDVPDGPSFLSQALISLDEAADYTASRLNDSVDAIAWPQEYGIDVQDVDNAAFVEAGIKDVGSNSSTVVRRFISTGSQQGKVDVLEISGAGPEASQKHLDGLAKHASRVTGVLDHDPERVKGAMSGTALERMEAPTVGTVNAWRRSVGAMIYSLAYKLAAILGESMPDGATVEWGAIFTPTAEDVSAWAQALRLASDGPVVSQKTAVEKFAQVLGISDPEDELERLEEQLEDVMPPDPLPGQVPPGQAPPGQPPPGQPDEDEAPAEGDAEE